MYTADSDKLDFVIETSGGSGQMGGAMDRVTDSTRAMIEKAKVAVVQMGEQFSEAVSQIPLQCEYVDVKFGIKFDAEAGVVVSRVSTSASLEVTLRVKPVRSNSPAQSVP